MSSTAPPHPFQGMEGKMGGEERGKGERQRSEEQAIVEMLNTHTHTQLLDRDGKRRLGKRTGGPSCSSDWASSPEENEDGKV